MIRLRNCDCIELLRGIDDNSIDALITDPPAGIGFLGKEWDKDKGGRDAWIAWLTEVMVEVNRVLKPGAHGLIWAIPRTAHWTATALENAGFEIRDKITHLKGSGFPKGLDISKAIEKYRKTNAAGAEASTEVAQTWAGWNTALKPGAEEWIMVRKKPSERNLVENILKWGVGGINIDACRIATKDSTVRKNTAEMGYAGGNLAKTYTTGSKKGRWPQNVILSEETAEEVDRHGGTSTSSVHVQAGSSPCPGDWGSPRRDKTFEGYGDRGGASRFFYCSKTSKKERTHSGRVVNKHPTVKPLKLMRYLIHLVTPPRGIVLDPFAGSGSTAVAAIQCQKGFIGSEMDPESFETAKARIEDARALLYDPEHPNAL